MALFRGTGLRMSATTYTNAAMSAPESGECRMPEQVAFWAAWDAAADESGKWIALSGKPVTIIGHVFVIHRTFSRVAGRAFLCWSLSEPTTGLKISIGRSPDDCMYFGRELLDRKGPKGLSLAIKQALKNQGVYGPKPDYVPTPEEAGLCSR
jgi:hypothetical protein